MRYLVIPGELDAIVWLDGDNSGVIRDGDAGWDAYQAWLEDGNTPEQEQSEQITMEQAIAMVEKEFERACAHLRGTSAQAEIDTWALQAAEARAYLADGSANTPIIDGIALPWEDKEALCHEVITKSDQYAAAMGDILMWRRIALAAVEALFGRGPRNGLSVMYPDVPSAT